LSAQTNNIKTHKYGAGQANHAAGVAAETKADAMDAEIADRSTLCGKFVLKSENVFPVFWMPNCSADSAASIGMSKNNESHKLLVRLLLQLTIPI
jgi:hypothetical protein